MITLLTLLLSSIPAPEAKQGVAADAHHVFAISNDEIAKYDKKTGERVAYWKGEPRLFPHMNSCAVMKTELFCAASNYPAVPMTSAVEIFDIKTLKHIRTHSLGRQYGSLTVMDWHEGAWWAVFANYEGKGGEPGSDYRATTLVKMDANFRSMESWLFPEAVLSRFAPKSCSGAVWADDGMLYVSGHDRPEVYVLRLPIAGSVLEYAGTLPVTTPGQAIDWDPVEPRTLWSIDRARRRIVSTKLPSVP